MINNVKINICILLLIWVFSSCHPVSFLTIRQINQYNVNNNREVKTGLWIECNNDTIVKVRYKEGMRYGKVISIYPTGSVEKGTCKNGEKDGMFKVYSAGGMLIYWVWFENGKEVRKKYKLRKIKDPPW